MLQAFLIYISILRHFFIYLFFSLLVGNAWHVFCSLLDLSNKSGDSDNFFSFAISPIIWIFNISDYYYISKRYR